MPKPLVLTLPLRSWAPATSRGLQPALPSRARAGKTLNESVQAKCSAQQWVVPGPRPGRQATGIGGCAALGVDGGTRHTHGIRVPLIRARRPLCGKTFRQGGSFREKS